jgi:predicted nucleic acid-binding protein
LAYLLDTNTVSYLIQKRPIIVDKVASAGGLSNLSVAAITAAELRYGVERMPGGRRKVINLADLFTVLGEIEVRPFTEDAAAAFG